MKVNRSLNRRMRLWRDVRLVLTLLTAFIAGFYSLGQFLLTEDIFDPLIAAPYELRSMVAFIICIGAYGYANCQVSPTRTYRHQ